MYKTWNQNVAPELLKVVEENPSLQALFEIICLLQEVQSSATWGH